MGADIQGTWGQLDVKEALEEEIPGSSMKGTAEEG